MNSSIDIDKKNHFLGYYYGVGEVLSLNFSPQPGMFFVNGETNSVWVWDALTRMWIDSNRVDSGLKAMLTDKTGNSPSDFVPSPKEGVKESYLYVAECDDVDFNPQASPRTITFKNFKNGNSSVSVTVRKTSIIILYWNGTYWEVSAVPMNIDWSNFATKTDLDNVYAKIGETLYENVVIGSNTSPNIFSLEPYRGKEISVNVSGSFSSFGYRDATISIGYKTLGESDMDGKWLSFLVPETATNFFVFNNTVIGETVVNVELKANISAEVSTLANSVEEVKNSVGDLNATVGYREYRGVEINSVKKIFSLLPFVGKTVMVKVNGYFQNFGYYLKDASYKSLVNKDNYSGDYFSFLVPEDASDFYVYTDNGGTTVDIELRANISAAILQKDVVTKGCVFMSLGDSITTESYYIKPLREILQPSKYYNLAVAGAWWADKPNTRYDGNPQFNGADNNVNNVIGNQVQKIIDNPDDYAEAPDIIIIAAGTNDADNLGVSNNTSINGIRSAIDLVYQNRDGIIPISEPTFDENDTYKEFRKTIAGAMRYCVTKLQQIFPRAKIYILTPIQGCFDSRDYYWGIATKQEYISECAKHLGVPVIHVGEECGINSDFEWRGAMWTAPTGSHERSGRDLIDGLHPNANGSKKMADYIALNIINSYKSMGKIYSVVGSTISLNGMVDGSTLKL